MDEVLQGLGSFSVTYIDDILVLTKKKNMQDHIKHIQQVFQRLRKHNVRLKMSKYNFARSEINYWGYRISARGVAPDVDKV